METCFNYCNSKAAFFSSDERKWINKIHRLAEQRPQDVVIIREPDDNDGCIYAQVPSSWLKINPPRVYTDEQIEVMTARLVPYRHTSENA